MLVLPHALRSAALRSSGLTSACVAKYDVANGVTPLLRSLLPNAGQVRFLSSHQSAVRSLVTPRTAAWGRPTFHDASARSYATSPAVKATKDPEHPNGLWYHPLSTDAEGTTFAVSYLSSLPAPLSDDSPAALAIFTMPASNASQSPAEYARQNPDSVKSHKPFWTLLHRVLQDDVVRAGRDAILVQEADLREAGWAHLADERQLLMPGRIPTPDAIIASVSFTECKLAPDSYTVNDTHRPITREEGFTVLRDVWLKALKTALDKA